MPKDKHNWVSRLKKKVKRRLKSRHSPAGKGYLAEQRKTVRTKYVEKGVKVAGLTQKELDRLRGKR